MQQWADFAEAESDEPGKPSRHAALAAALALVVALMLAGCASVPPQRSLDDAGAIVIAPIDLGGSIHSATWYLPQGEAQALIVLQHGFTRRCSHLRETTRQLMVGGLMALCIDAAMAGGNLPLADALAAGLEGGLVAPDGRSQPERIIVGGHSAGGRFAARLGAQLAAQAPQRLAGALLFDPVATAGFETELRTLSAAGARPVLAVFAQPHACNASLNAAPALRQVRQDALAAGRDGFVGLLLTEGSTHADIEGEDTDWIAVAACGRPRPENVQRLRALGLSWAQAMARGETPATPPTGAAWQLIE
jgi:pimeloyl-ACP methyl ester carboxylesterase